jgi:Cu/Zn superoxide dismutase
MKDPFLRMIAVIAFVLTALMLSAAEKSVTVAMKDGTGHDVGTAVISDAGKGVKIVLDLKHLSPGDHAIHIHASPLSAKDPNSQRQENISIQRTRIMA